MLFYKVFASVVLRIKMSQKLALFEYRFSSPIITRKNGNNQKRKPMCTNTMSLVLKFNLYHFLAIAFSEPLSGNQIPLKLIKDQ